MRIPSSCYRLQLSPDFTLEDARRAAPYLRELGVGDLYLSPILAARPESTHGYDVTDPTRVRPEIGGEPALRALAAEAARLDMGLLVDTVPNHMAADHRNPWWWDVLRLGRDAAHAHVFDIDWDAPGCDGRVVLPVLDGEPGDLIGRGELRLEEGSGGPALVYYDRRFPLAPGSLDRAGGDVAALAAAQHYRLCDWREAPVAVNYRRFFDVADLVAVRAERADVFAATHGLLLKLVGEGIVTGLRIDHIDGLADPAAYLDRLAEATGGAYVVVEKILARDEDLPSAWACEGTTGYDFLALAGGLFVDPRGAGRLHRLHRRLTGLPPAFATVAETARRRVLHELFPADLEHAARLAEAAGLAAGEPGALREALAELTVRMEVYRTYADERGLDPPSRRWLTEAAAAAEPALSGEAAARLGALVEAIAAPTAGTLTFVRRWQELTGPVAAKGVEDTALYVDTSLVARNEPGCEPGWPATDAVELHRRLAARRGHPLNATSTHDTKRSEDVRMRIAALSELPDEWEERVDRWRALNAPLRARPDAAPDAGEEWLLYQTLVGAWPLDIGARGTLPDRVGAFMLKAAREAKRHTSWREPDLDYERDLTGFVAAALDPGNAPFLADVDELARRAATIGARSSLALLVLKLAAPGVPDVYWGNDLPDLSLVDPDNRRPVDFSAHARLLATIGDGAVEGLEKLAVTQRGLELRRREPDIFAHGAYVPLETSGRFAAHVVAFARVHEDRWAVAVVPRLMARIDDWGDTQLRLPSGAPSAWEDVLSGSRVRGPAPAAGELFDPVPVALLTGRVEAAMSSRLRIGHTVGIVRRREAL
jgi:(1->4)-alpha-D-glucan 1-alpha-D-glucosylmutase